MRSSQHRYIGDQPVGYVDQQIDDHPDDAAERKHGTVLVLAVFVLAVFDAAREQPEQLEQRLVREEIAPRGAIALGRETHAPGDCARVMRAIAFLVAAFVFLAACNRPMSAERAVAPAPGVAERAYAANTQRLKPAEQAADRDRDAPIADEKLSDKIREALITETGLSARDLEVSTKHGVVTLSGVIEAQSDQDRMMLIAMSIDGVRSVVSRLVLDRPFVSA